MKSCLHETIQSNEGERVREGFMKKIRSYIWDHKWAYLVGIVSLVIAVSLDMLSPQLTRHVVDDVILGGNMSELKFILLGFLAVGLGRFIFQYLKEYTFDKTGSLIASENRRDVFDHIQSLSAEYFDRSSTGELMARVKDDIDHIWDSLSFVGMLIIEVSFHTTVILICMFSLNKVLALIPLVAMITCGTIAVVMEQKRGKVYEDISEENASLNTVAEEDLQSVRTVKAFAREKFEIGKFLSHNQRYYDLNMTQSKLFVKYYPYFSVVGKVVPLLTLLFGGMSVMHGNMTLGGLTAFMEYSMNIVWPLAMLGWLSNSMSSAVASEKKLKKIYEEKPVITDPAEPVILDRVDGKIEFDDVSFHKADGFEILKHISFTVEPGKTLGIMGATGA